jgi:hypothetical protein
VVADIVPEFIHGFPASEPILQADFDHPHGLHRQQVGVPGAGPVRVVDAHRIGAFGRLRNGQMRGRVDD